MSTYHTQGASARTDLRNEHGTPVLKNCLCAYHYTAFNLLQVCCAIKGWTLQTNVWSNLAGVSGQMLVAE